MSADEKDIEFYVKARDFHQGMANAYGELIINKNPFQGDSIAESIFSSLVGWESRTGNKLGNFDVTSRQSNNNSDTYSHAFNILKANHATIKERFHGKGYNYSYWLYQDCVYRQKLSD